MAIPPVRLDPWQNITAVAWGGRMDGLILVRVQFRSDAKPEMYSVDSWEAYNLNDLEVYVSNEIYGGGSVRPDGVEYWEGFAGSVSNICGVITEFARAIDPEENDGYDRETMFVWDTAAIRAGIPSIGDSFDFTVFVNLGEAAESKFGNTTSVRIKVEALFGEGLIYSIENGTVYDPTSGGFGPPPGTEDTKIDRAEILITGIPAKTVIQEGVVPIGGWAAGDRWFYTTSPLYQAVKVNTAIQTVEIYAFDL